MSDSYDFIQPNISITWLLPSLNINSAGIRLRCLHFARKLDENGVAVQPIEVYFEEKENDFVSVKEGVKVHKKDCPNSISLRSNYAYRIITANWIDSENHEFNAQIQISGIDDIGLINTITSLISNSMNVNMNRISFETNDGTFSGFISVEVKNRVILKILLKKLSSIDGIEKVSRK